MSVVEDLRNAKRELLRRGWTQGILESGDGRVCAVGAINRATDSCKMDARTHAVQQQLTVYLDADCFKTELVPLAAFNDRPDTTMQDVVNLFDKALADLGGLG